MISAILSRITALELDLPKHLDDYDLGRELGRGATGRVFVAEDTVLIRPVAIKLINNLDPASRQRFLAEARAVAKIHHPNVVGIYRIGTYQHRPYFVTELVRGNTLAELSRPIAPQVALDIAIGVARGLAAAHRHNIVHCDLKPSNVMIDPDGVAKIIDFGLARIAVEGASAGHMPVGTPDYMAPEVWAGETPGKRADVYSLGAVLFELLSGAPPFGDVAPTELRARVTGHEAPALRDRAPDVDPALGEVVARCLRRDRTARFADGDELREALEHLHAVARQPVRTDRGDENPYRGLLPFEASHRGVFFGRRAEIDAVVARLRSDPIALVTGDSGVGKSSLCRAGVVPAIVDGELGGTWRALTLVPGVRPLTALAAALGVSAATLGEHPAQLIRELRRYAGDDGLIVFIDQLEELITVGDPDEVAALDAGLAGFYDGVPGLRLLATVRADFLVRISNLSGLGHDLSRSLYFLRPMQTARLREVIVGPAASAGTRFESDEIVDELAAAAAEAGSGGLPLLSFALADLWEARDRGNVIARAAVTAMGGVAGALSRHADVVISSMGPRDRAHARRLLLRLVTPMGTRARRTAHELELGDDNSGALDALVNGRLVVVHDGEPEPTYELAHECLLVGWPTLRQWLDDDTADRAARERLAAAAAEWARLGRNNEATWQGTRLAEAVALDPRTLSADDRAFVFASRRAARRRRWQRGLTAFGAIALAATAFIGQRYLARRELTAAVGTELALAQRARAEAEHADAERAARARLAYAQFDALDWAGGEATWQQALGLRERAETAYRDASQHVESAVAKDPSRGDLRDLLGDLLVERAQLAEQAYDFHERDELVARIAPYDADGSRRKARSRPGHLIIHAHGAEITLAPMRAATDSPELIRADAPPRSLGTGDADVREPPGGYVVVLSAPGRVTVRAPIVVERARELVLDIAPPRTADVPPGMIYVPAGTFLYGNANEDDREALYATTPLHRRSTPAFLIGRHEVTFGDWLAFIDAQPAGGRAGLLPSVPHKLAGGIEVVPEGAHWRLELWIGERHYSAGWGEPIVYAGRTYHERQDWRRFPVVGVTAHAATAYAAWLVRSGRLPGARLCSEVEWERAARGADGRPYPGGRGVASGDADIDVAHGTQLMGPDEVGAHPASRSPFGLDDTVGNAFEWTQGEPILASAPASAGEHDPDDGYILRGGSYQHDRKTAHLTNRAPMPGSLTDPSVGVRLCATPSLPQ